MIGCSIAGNNNSQSMEIFQPNLWIFFMIEQCSVFFKFLRSQSFVKSRWLWDPKNIISSTYLDSSSNGSSWRTSLAAGSYIQLWERVLLHVRLPRNHFEPFKSEEC